MQGGWKCVLVLAIKRRLKYNVYQYELCRFKGGSMQRRQRREHKEMISTVDLTHTEVVWRPGPLATRWRQAWLSCQCALVGHAAPPRRSGQWLLCDRCGKLVGD
jgi:hypothetical protein